MAKKTDDDSGLSEDGHFLLDGARWHYPRISDPSACAVSGCNRILGLPPEPDDRPDDEQSGEGPDTALSA